MTYTHLLVTNDCYFKYENNNKKSFLFKYNFLKTKKKYFLFFKNIFSIKKKIKKEINIKIYINLLKPYPKFSVHEITYSIS